ncbi:MAG: RIP metalloprotease RseP [Gemmatimonadales bacterium]
MLLTIASLIVVLGVLIFVHELGHFLVAKAVGIQVLRFSLGFGRPVIEWRRGETEYWISWIPLGGYVKMAGLEEEGMVGELEGGKAGVAIDPERTFDRKPLWARMAVILAGVTMNVLFAFVVYVGVGTFMGVAERATTQVDTVHATRLPPGAEALAALQHGDRIIRIDGDTVATWEDVLRRIVEADTAIHIEVAGRPQPITLTLPASDTGRMRVVRALEPLFPARIGLVYPGEPAARAGLRSGDVVIKADGDTVRSWHDMLVKIRSNAARPVDLTLRRRRPGRGDSLVQITVTPKTLPDPDSAWSGLKTIGLIGVEADPPQIKKALPFTTAVTVGARQTVLQTKVILVSLKRLVFGQASMRDLGGPILIAQVSGQAARLGLDRFLMFMAFFSVSLAVLNLLPIPVLDGGHAMFLIVEAIRGKPLSAQLRMRLTQIGMLIILGIMVLAISNDVLRNIR